MTHTYTYKISKHLHKFVTKKERKLQIDKRLNPSWRARVDHLCNNDNAATAVIFAILQVVYQQVAAIEFTRVGKLLQQNRFFSRFIEEQFDEVVVL